jgi:hypothetical protein
VNTSNAAFEDNAGGETARVLRVAAERLQYAETLESLADAANSEPDLRDINGNKVGKIKVQYSTTAERRLGGR